MVHLTIHRWSWPGDYPEICEPEAPWQFEVELDITIQFGGLQLIEAELFEPGCPSEEPEFADLWHNHHAINSAAEACPTDERRQQARRECLRALIEGNVRGIASLLPEAIEEQLSQLDDLTDFLRHTPIDQLDFAQRPAQQEALF